MKLDKSYRSGNGIAHPGLERESIQENTNTVVRARVVKWSDTNRIWYEALDDVYIIMYDICICISLYISRQEPFA